MRKLYFIPDTNLFIQCRSLEELDWSLWSEFDEIYLVVCRPVQREIDNLKNKGKGRVVKRARKANSLFRKLIDSRHGYELIHNANPQVGLIVDPTCTHSPNLKDKLDYSEIDDKIVGCVHSYKAQNPIFDVRLLTHDTGPMASAKMCSLPFFVIPDDWLLPPENSEAEKEIIKLRTEVEKYEKAEPKFVISCLNDNGDEINLLEFESVCYKRLTETEISELMDSLIRQFPLATDFGEEETIRRNPTNPTNYKLGIEVFTPASEQEITDYTEKEYPEWVENCKQILQQLHSFLEKQSNPVKLLFSAVNVGTRPGKSTLVTITAKGNFLIRPPKIEDADEVDGKHGHFEKMLSLPSPPRPPKGKWTTRNSIFNINKLYNELQLTGISSFRSPGEFKLPNLSGSYNFQRDPNEFYYKPDHATEPEASFSLECAQWRHSIEAESFEGELCFSRDIQEVSGALECLIQAENLSAPIKKTIQVRGSIRHVSAREHAESLVKKLINTRTLALNRPGNPGDPLV